MTDLVTTAPAFVEMAHRTVWASVATVDSKGRPRTRILHPIWEWDGSSLVGWVGTGPTRIKRSHLERTPFVSVNYWSPNHDTCTAECRASWYFDDETCQRIWDLYLAAPPPLGYDPAMIPVWADGPTSPAFAALRLDPWRLRVFPGTVLLGTGGEVSEWNE